MKKTYKYTVLTVVLAIVFSFGSMAGMNLILKARERQLLTKSGRSVMEVPVQTNVGQEKDQNFNKDRGTLTIEQIEKVVSLWDEPDEVVVHNPADGQISMGEAIRAGQEWLINMGMEVERKDNDEVHQYATLSTAVRESSEEEDDNKDVQTAPYNSFWRVQFYSSSLEAFLYVNAVTGQVWSADIILYDDFPKEIPSKKLRDFVELCGLKVSGSESEEELWQPSYSWMERVEIENSKLIAEMQFMRSQTGYPGSGYGKEGLLNFRSKILYKENVNIVFKLSLDW
ncbi:MAG: hypothetical protein HFI71_14050 [Lachnospiraceae bacterium]|nr:hypothetical protein [Lachnospiraceae bacterium]